MKIRIALILMALTGTALAEPPYSGTIFIDRDIITSSDPTTYLKSTSKGRGSRSMFDRRRNRFVRSNAYLFEARYKDSRPIEIQVNPEFGKTRARSHALKYARVIGRLPKCLRAEVYSVSIQGGIRPFGGGYRNLLIHTGQADVYSRDGVLEETLVHEAAHTSLDRPHATAAGWKAARASDAEFISTYARDNPTREDIAESFLPWLAVRFRPERIDQTYIDTVRGTIPARINYFNSKRFVVSPVK